MKKHKQKRASLLVKLRIAMFAVIGMVVFSALANDNSAANIGKVLAGTSVLATVGAAAGKVEKSEQEVLMEKINATVTDLIEEKHVTSKAELKAIKELLEGMKDYPEVKKEAIRLAAEVKALTEKGAYVPSPAKQSTAEQIKAYIAANPTKWNAFKSGESKGFGIEVDEKGNVIAAIELKAAGTMTVAGNTGSSAFVPNVEIMPGIVDLARNKPFIENFANVTGTSSSRIVWVNKTNPDGNATFLAEGSVKQLVDFDLETEESFAKKCADKIKISTEMLDDIDFIAGEIERELRYGVDIKVDTELLSGAGDGTSSATTLKGLKSYAGGYVLTTISTTTPNNFDAIRAAIAQIVSLNFNPSHVFINPIDGANMDIAKDAQGRPLAMEYKTPDGKIYRLQIVETNQMAVGDVLVGDMSKFVVRNYKGFSIRYGWVNDDFEKNLVTILGERRLHCFVSDNNTGAFVDDTFASIKTAITLP